MFELPVIELSFHQSETFDLRGFQRLMPFPLLFLHQRYKHQLGLLFVLVFLLLQIVYFERVYKKKIIFCFDLYFHL